MKKISKNCNDILYFLAGLLAMAFVVLGPGLARAEILNWSWSYDATEVTDLAGFVMKQNGLEVCRATAIERGKLCPVESVISGDKLTMNAVNDFGLESNPSIEFIVPLSPHAPGSVTGEFVSWSMQSVKF